MQIIDSITGTLAILLSDLFLYLSFTGVGLGIRWAYGLRTLSVHDVFIAFWVGFSGITFILLAWNFFLPVNDIALLLVVITGLVSIRPWWARLRQLVSLPWTRATKIGCGVFLLLVLWIANNALGDLTSWDSALYHLQAIKWAESYPAVPGIANLYGPLGFNNSSFLYGALVNAGPWQDRGFHIANGLIILALLPLGIAAAHRVFTGRMNPAEVVVAMVFIIPTIALINPEVTTSYLTDAPAIAVMLVVIPLVIAALSTRGRADGREGDYRVVVISTLLAVGVCMKFHIVVFASLVWILIVWSRWFASTPGGEQGHYRALTLATIVPVLFAALLIGRGILLSGYPLFPSTLFGIQVDWMAPVEHARAEYDFIVYSGRASASALGVEPGVETIAGWLPNWLHHAARDPYVMYVPIMLAALGSAGALFRRRRVVFPNRPQMLLLVPVGISIVSWFFIAPAPRYATYLFWTLAGWSISYIWPESPAAQRRLGLGLIALAMSVPLVLPVTLFVNKDPLLLDIIRTNFTLNRTAWMSTVRPPASRLYTTASGAEVQVPVSSGGRCWNHPIPCTPNPAPNLELREPGDLSKGFRVKGEWQMEDWPYDWLPHFLETWRTIEAEKTAK